MAVQQAMIDDMVSELRTISRDIINLHGRTEDILERNSALQLGPNAANELQNAQLNAGRHSGIDKQQIFDALGTLSAFVAAITADHRGNLWKVRVNDRDNI